MLAVGIPPVAANASNTVALVPASLIAAWAQRRELADAGPRRLPVLAALSLGGGIAGAVLLLLTSDRAFMALVPWLLLVATLLFALSPHLLALIRRGRPGHAGGLRLNAWTVLVLVPCLVYGGYFGAGLGIMLLAGLAVAGLEELRVANALKNGMSALVNGVAVAVFVSQGIVVWPAALTMMAGAALGGFAGARIARRLPQKLFRAIVIAVGSLLTLLVLRAPMTVPFATGRPADASRRPGPRRLRDPLPAAGQGRQHGPLHPAARRRLAGRHPPHRRRALVRARGRGRALAPPGRARGDRGADTPHRALDPARHLVPVPQPRHGAPGLRHRHDAALARHGRGGAGGGSLAPSWPCRRIGSPPTVPKQALQAPEELAIGLPAQPRGFPPCTVRRQWALSVPTWPSPEVAAP